MAPLIEPSDGETYHADFRLSITKALGDQLTEALKELRRAPLNDTSLGDLRDRPGVYQLYLGGEFVYVGKAETTLPGRLRQHQRKLSGRQNISLEDVSFSCLYVAEDFSALAPEKLLINKYSQGGQIAWNNNGFGNKDPGRKRDHTAIKANHFDKKFRIDLGRQVDGLSQGVIPLKALAKRVKDGLPFNFRYDVKKLGGVNVPVDVNDPVLTADEAFSLIAQHLPDSWQIVALLGYVIMYPDSPAEYPSAWRYYRGSESFDTEPTVTAPGDIEEDEGSEDEEPEE